MGFAFKLHGNMYAINGHTSGVLPLAVAKYASDDIEISISFGKNVGMMLKLSNGPLIDFTKSIKKSQKTKQYNNNKTKQQQI